MRLRLTTTRLLQVGFMFLLAVCVAQVIWWLVDQEQHTRTVRLQVSELYRGDRLAAERLLRDGVSPTFVEQMFPHLRVSGEKVEVTPQALASLDHERLRRLRQYGWEGGFFLLVLVGCMAVIWKALREEASLRRRQKNFLAAVSHELKNPLASLQLSAETMSLRNLAPEQTQKLVMRILEDVRRMSDMVSNVLDTSRLDEGRLELQREPVNLGEIVTALLPEWRPRASQAGVTINTSIPDDLEVRSDRLAVRTVVHNLLDNAIKATAAAGGGKVSLTACRSDGGIQLEVRDTGVGLRPEEVDKLFQKFYRAGDESSRRTAGSGLGLFLVQRFLDLDGGRIRAHSDGPGKGALFTASWPESRAPRA
ncbi:MAG: HAMP domain-containing sensor histidine kinase [Thermoanaerobaculia bacterium]